MNLFLNSGVMMLAATALLVLVSCKPTEAQNSIDNLAKSKLSLPFLVIDMTGEGINFDSLDKSNMNFDVDGDGLAEHTAWIQKNEDLLMVLTRDEDVRIKATKERIIAGLTGGIEKLKKLDTNKDGTYDDRDSIEGSKDFFFRPGNLSHVKFSDDGSFKGLAFTAGCEFKSLTFDTLSKPSKVSGQKVIPGGTIYCKNNTKLKFVEVKFQFDDSNVRWDGLCKILEKDPTYNKEFRKNCSTNHN